MEAKNLPRMVIFDFDGVIIDSLKVIEQFDQWLYPGLTDEEWKETNYGNYFQKMHPHEHKRRVVTDDQMHQKREEFYTIKSKCAIFPGLKECIMNIPEDTICVLNSNSKLGGVLPFLQIHGLDKKFSFLATKEVSPSKQDKLLLSLEKYNVKKEDAVFVTDTVGDLLEGEAVGINVIAVTWGIHSKQDFLEYGPYKIAENAEELRKVIADYLI